jgi:hypothetical protein
VVVRDIERHASLCRAPNLLARAHVPPDGHALAEVDAVEYAIEEAMRQSADVVVLGHEPEWLHRHGEIAALLRW